MLAAGGPAGVMNEYGRPSMRLKEVFKSDWKEKDGRWALEVGEPFFSGGGAKAWRSGYGRGKVIVFDGTTMDMFNLLPEYTEKSFGSDNPEIQFCMREKDGVKYLYALNWSVDKTEEAEIFIKGGFNSVIDEGLEVKMEVPVYKKNGRTYFKTKLAPAGLTLFKIE
jgi:hypothetical protein